MKDKQAEKGKSIRRSMDLSKTLYFHNNFDSKFIPCITMQSYKTSTR